jgi:hypothetical protein
MLSARACYVYGIIVDGTVRYIGKGTGARLFTHVINAKRTAAGCGRKTGHPHPRLHRRLVEAIRTGARITMPFGQRSIAVLTAA